MHYLLALLFPLFLLADSATLLEVKDDTATAKVRQAEPGLDGIVIRHFNDMHSAIIANVQVTAFDSDTHMVRLALTPYLELEQNALPSGHWKPQPGDELILAPDYSRALLIAPDQAVYKQVTSAFKTLHWIHPDRFAAYLSEAGHPSPLTEDFSAFCSDNAVGLLYVYNDQHLFTLDCKSFTLLQTADAALEVKETQLPFYSRVEHIRAGLLGTGTEPMEQYGPYYMKLIEQHNADNGPFKTYLEPKNSSKADTEDQS